MRPVHLRRMTEDEVMEVSRRLLEGAECASVNAISARAESGVATDSIDLEVERIERAEGVMKRSLLLVAACLAAGTSLAQTSDEQRPRTVYELRMERIRAREKRIQETRPQRRDSPLREENIRDEEVREIQAAARGIVPKAIVNIAGVVT